MDFRHLQKGIGESKELRKNVLRLMIDKQVLVTMAMDCYGNYAVQVWVAFLVTTTIVSLLVSRRFSEDAVRARREQPSDECRSPEWSSIVAKPLRVPCDPEAGDEGPNRRRQATFRCL